MSKHHRVRTHHWRLGRLEVKDRIFETEAEALVFANNNTDHANSVKIFDDQNQLVHNIIDVTVTVESYA